MISNKTQKIIPLFIDTYLVMIRNSIGSNMFRNLYAEVDGQKKDIVENGNLSCAYYVSSLLFLFKLAKEVHATVSGTERDLKESGWQEITEPKIGCVLIWAETEFEEDKHKHIGFYMGNEKAISNDYQSGCPTEHDWQFRKIEKILWHQKLDSQIDSFANKNI